MDVQKKELQLSLSSVCLCFIQVHVVTGDVNGRGKAERGGCARSRLELIGARARSRAEVKAERLKG